MTTPSTIDVLVTGSVFTDLVFAGAPIPDPGTEVYASAFALSPGGSANRAFASARLGRRTALLTELGDDPLGSVVRDLLTREPNLALDWVTVRDGFHSPTSVALADATDRSFITYEEPARPLDWPADAPAVGVAHLSVADEIPAWAQRLGRAGTRIVAGVGWDDSGEWSRAVLDRLQHVDMFVPNDAEAMGYTRTADAVSAARALGEHVGVAVVTRGPRGVVAVDHGELVEVPTITVDAVDPTGAGDVFVGTLMATFDVEWPLADRLRLATLCASLSVRRLGGAISAPTPASILRYLDEAKPDGEWQHIADWVSRNTTEESAP